MERNAGRKAVATLAFLLAGYAWIVLSHAGRSVGGSDSSGYFNEARALAAGRLVEIVRPFGAATRSEEIHVFIPLGYVPGPEPGTMAPFYPMGLPLHFVAAAGVVGWDLGPFLVSPLAAVGCLLLVYLVGRELGLSRWAALSAAAILAAVPVFSFFAVQPMSDVVAAFWALATIFLALRSRAAECPSPGGRIPGSLTLDARTLAAASGFAFGVGVLVRPSSAIVAVPLLFILPMRPKLWLWFAAGGLPCAAALFAFNRAAYGGALRTGYALGGATSGFAWSNFPVRFVHYGRWIGAMMTPLVPAAWLWTAAAGGRQRARVRLLLSSWFLGFFLFYCFYGPYDAWWYTRYLLPGIPALAIGAAMAGEDLLARARRAPGSGRSPRRRIAAVRIGLAAAFFLVALTGYRVSRRYRVLDIGRTDSVYPEAVRWAAARLPDNALVAAMQLTGAMKTYGSRPFFRWDWMEAKNFPDFRRRMDAAGYRLYALTFQGEARDAAPRLPGQWSLVATRGEVSLWRLE